MEPVKKLLEDSVTGFAITGHTRRTISQKMNRMLGMDGPLKIIELLTILSILADTKEKKKLASMGFIQNFKTSGSEQITKVCDFIMNNFTSDLRLDQVAEIANMSPNTFCSFFKQRTRKTFVNFLNEVRIGYACKLLSGERYNISEICYLSGFHNLSNFNRQFKKILNKTPYQYKLDMSVINN
jgi:AraC-like DNA-binding protein